MGTTKLVTSGEARGSVPVRRRVQRVMALMVAAFAVVLGVMATSSATANAVSTQCGGGRCTVYLSKSETAAMAQGRAPALPAATPWQIKASYVALVQGHRWFAQQYTNRGWCSAFRLSIYPWESQGYTGYRC
ncbi:hypothetical protein [Rhodococcus sp. 24CO]|uniref:hypothetical protein n=1 Tax=Rhodococcus sp. 24CO TaxID=3117460 RepID=UPI003D3377B7